MKKIERISETYPNRFVDITCKIDKASYRWLLKESQRTGIGPEVIATALLRKSCAEETQVGAPSI